jgi:hypothetical protein
MEQIDIICTMQAGFQSSCKGPGRPGGKTPLPRPASNVIKPWLIKTNG